MIKYLIAILLTTTAAYSQTIKTLGYNTTNGQVSYSGSNTLTFTNPLGFSNAAATRTNLGLGASWLTNSNSPATTNATNLTAGTLPDARLSTNVAILSNLPSWATTTNADVARTNLGIGWSALTNTNSINFQKSLFGTNVEIYDSTGIVGISLSESQTKLVSAISFPYLGGSGQASVSRTNLGLGWIALTNTNATNFRLAIGLSLAALTNTNVTNFRTDIGLGSLATNDSVPSGAAASNSILTADGAGGSAFVSTLPRLTLASGTITNNNPTLDLSQTWNNSAATFTGFQQTITNTASAVGSRLFNFVVGSTSAFSARIMLGAGPTDALAIGGGDRGLVFGNNTFTNPNAGFFTLRWQANLAGFNSSAILAWGSDVYNLGYDLALQRDAADTFAQRRGSNAQTFRLYNTYTDSTNYERGFIGWSSNTLRIGTEAGGTNSARSLELQTGGVARIAIAANGDTQINGFTTFNQNVSIATGRVLGANQINLNNTSTALLALGTDSTIRWGSSSATAPLLKRSSTTLQVRLADDTAYSVLDAQLRAQGTAPTNSTATGTAGDIRYDTNNFLYICVASNTWRRTSLTNW